MTRTFNLEIPPFLHTDIQENLKKENADILFESRSSILVQLRNSNICLLSSFDQKESEELLDSLSEDPDRYIVVRGPYLKEAALHRGYSAGSGTECYQYVYALKEPLPERGILKYSSAGPDDFDRVRSVYHLLPDDELYHEMYEGEFIKGIDRDGNFTCFIGRHIEKSIGLLYVFEEYRHKGYAAELQAHMMNELLKKGAVPYRQVYTDNTASVFLQEKLGLQRADAPVIWLTKNT